MLLSSVSSCIDCSQFNENECINTSYCKFENSACITNDTEENSGSFISCKGSELSCEYTVKESNIDDPPDTSDNSSVDEVDSQSSTPRMFTLTNKEKTDDCSDCCADGCAGCCDDEGKDKKTDEE